MPTALVTNALELGGPSVTALIDGGFHVVAHDRTFSDPDRRAVYGNQHPTLIPLSEQAPAAIVETAWSYNGGFDVLVLIARTNPPRTWQQGVALGPNSTPSKTAEQVSRSIIETTV